MKVSEAIRGQDIGRRILAVLENLAHEAGHQMVWLVSNGALRDAHALFRRHGYADIARYNDNPYAYVWFEKKALRVAINGKSPLPLRRPVR